MPKRRAAAAAESEPPVIPQATYERVPLEAIVESALNPRTRIDETQLAELAESVRQHGIIEPIVLRRVEAQDDGPVTWPAHFEVVAGARRTRAARLAGLVDVPAMIRVVSDSQLLELALQENIHQSTMGALDEARALAKLAELDPIYRDDRVLASKIGRSETYVRDRRKLLRLDPLVQAALDGGAITAKHAERIARLPLDQHAVALRACFSQMFLDDADDGEFRSVDECIEAARWDVLSPALVGLRRFDQWADENGKLDITAPEVQQQLVSELADDADLQCAVEEVGDAPADLVAAATAEMVQLSTEWLDRKTAAAMQLVGADGWERVTDGATCEYAVRGLIVHGEDDNGQRRTAPEVVTVCLEKRKCKQHWPEKAKPSEKATAQDDRYEKERREREQRQAAWEAVRPRYIDALVAHSRKATLTRQLVAAALGDYEVDRVAADFGVKLTDASARQVLALASVYPRSREQFEQGAKALGLNLKKLDAAVKVKAKPGAAATKKPAAKKAAKKGKGKK